MRILLGLIFCFCLLGCGQRGETWVRIERSGTLRVGLDPSYPPFETLSNDVLSGIDIDLMRAVGQELGLDVQFDIIGFDGLYDALLTGRVDVLASALLVDETRTKEFAYSEPYFNAGQVMVVRAGTDGTTPPQTVAVELGAEGHVVATQKQLQNSALTIQTMTAPQDALEAVLNGEADAAYTDSVSARLFVAQTAGLVIVEAPLTVDPYALVTRAADDVLTERLNSALRAVDKTPILTRHLDAPALD